MKTKAEKEAIRATVMLLGVELLKSTFDTRQRIDIRNAPVSEVMKLILVKQQTNAYEQLSPEQYQRLKTIERVMRTLAQKLLHCESDEMLNHVAHVVESINTAEIYIAEPEEIIMETA